MDTITKLNHAALIRELQDIRYELEMLDDRVFNITQSDETVAAGLDEAYNDFDRKFFAARVSIDRIVDAIGDGTI